MKIAIHQPEHFPYLGFFEKMKSVDLFVILDDVQFVKGNWHNRNRFINKNGEWEYFGVQVEKDAYKKRICDVKIVDGNWRKKVVKKIQQNFSIDMQKYYEGNSLLSTNIESIKWGMDKLNISTPLVYSSELNVDSKNTERIIDICKILKADTYLSGLGAKDYLQEELFTEIELEYFNKKITNFESVIAL